VHDDSTKKTLENSYFGYNMVQLRVKFQPLVAWSYRANQSSNILNWMAPWKNRSTTTKLRKSLVKPVTRQKTCNYNELFGSCTRNRHAWCI